MINTIRSLIEARQIFVNEEQNAIVIRADADSLEIAEKVIEANDLPKPEVVLNLEFLEVNRNDLEKLGIDFSPLNIQAGFAKGNPPTNVTSSSSLTGTSATLVNIRDLESAMFERNVLFTLPTVTLNFLKQTGVTKTLANPQLRALDGAKSQVHVGDRVPVITVTVSGVDNRSENVQYVDVGVKFNAEPKILSNDEVEIKIEAEVSNIVSENRTPNGTTVYRIGTRNAKTLLRLKDGETTVIGGLIQNRTSRTKSGIIFLSEIPILGRLFSSYEDKVDQSDIFVSITPHITKGIIQPPLNVTKIWSGTEDRLSARPMLKSVSEPNIDTRGKKGDERPKPVEERKIQEPAIPQKDIKSVQEIKEELMGVKPEDLFKDEIVFVAPIVPEVLGVGEEIEVEIAFSEIPPIVEFEVSGQVNPLFLEPVSFKESRPPMKEGDIYQWAFDEKSGSFNIYAKVSEEISGTFTVGIIDIKGRRKAPGMEMILLKNCRVKTKDGKQYTIRTVNGFMEVQ
jgi:general secretion pathway protein D